MSGHLLSRAHLAVPLLPAESDDPLSVRKGEGLRLQVPGYPLQSPGRVGAGLRLWRSGVGEGHVTIQQRLGLAELLQLGCDPVTDGGAQDTRQSHPRHDG